MFFNVTLFLLQDCYYAKMITTILLILLTAAFIVYKLSTRNFDYWKKRSVPYVEPLPFIGNFLDVFAQRMTLGHFLAKCYNEFPTPYFGMFVLNKPYLVIRSPDLIKNILVKDFNYFCNRTLVADEQIDPIASNALFVATNPEWKIMRSKITPAFTMGKAKNMIPLINRAAGDMKAYLSNYLEESSIEAKEVCAKYATDVVATCAFGIDAHCFENENAQFRVIGRKLFDFHWKTAIRQTCYFLAPGLVKLFRMPFIDHSVANFMREVVWSTIKERERTNHKRNDIIDIIIQIKNKSSPDDEIKFEGDRIVAQAGQFYTGGLESVSTTISFTLYELCIQPDIQHKLRTEIKTILSQYGEINYEALQEMKYLHMVICETLRKYPVLPFLDRLCMEDYKIPDSELVIEKGTPVYIPMFGLHYDPEYFPEPEKYDPDRFSDQNKHKMPSYSYIPFGEGPRNCIGDRFGLLVTKLGLIHILSEFEVEKSAATPVPIVFETKGFLLGSIVGLPMKFLKHR